MPAGNKDLMYLIANGAGGAKEQYGHATGAYAPRTPGKASHDHRGEQSDEEKLYGMGNATDVRAHPHANGSKSARPDIRGSRIGAPGHSVLRLGFTRGIDSLNARSLTLHHTRGGLAHNDVSTAFCSVSTQMPASVAANRTIAVHPIICFTRAKGQPPFLNISECSPKWHRHRIKI